MPKAIRSPNGLAIAALFILLSPARVAAQSHQGLVEYFGYFHAQWL